MLFNKRKKEEEEKRIQEEKELKRQQMEAQLQREREEEEKRAKENEAKKNTSPYKFSKPNPWPKELASVLKEMLKKLFPDAKKAYLVQADYEEKTGYLLVVDIDARYHKIINIYLDGQTKRVRGDKPIECILYSKSASLTDGMLPFYEKEESDFSKTQPRESEYALKSALDDIRSEYSVEFKSEINPEVEPEVEPEGEPEGEPEVELNVESEIESEIEFKVEKTEVRVVPETKQQLFALMNRHASSDDEETKEIAYSGFGEYKFCIPYETDGDFDMENPPEEFPDNAKLVMLINKGNGIKAIPFFTDREDASIFAKEKNCSFAVMKYTEYKEAAHGEKIISSAAEGIIINPSAEQILLPPDHPLL